MELRLTIAAALAGSQDNGNVPNNLHNKPIDIFSF